MTEKQRTKKNADEPEGAALTFEASLVRLEKTIERLENEELTLDASLELFEQGVTLIRACDTHLKKAQGKISELLKGENGSFVEKTLGITLESFISKDTHDA